MSTVSYYVQDYEYGFETDLRFTGKEKMFDLEEHLMIEVTEHKKHLQPSVTGPVHDIQFVDDSGYMFRVKDFLEIGNLELMKS